MEITNSYTQNIKNCPKCNKPPKLVRGSFGISMTCYKCGIFTTLGYGRIMEKHPSVDKNSVEFYDLSIKIISRVWNEKVRRIHENSKRVQAENSNDYCE